jgi:ABC-2 type transport system ATP-binding protein
VVKGSRLITFHGEGPDIGRLTHELAGKPGVETVAPFGAAAHVSGTDRRALEAAIAPWRNPPWRWSEVEPTLEDVFIQLMGQAQDNYA